MNKITGVNTKNETYNFIGKLNAVGRDGVGLDFHWDGTKLGIKKENEDTFEYVDLQGDTQMIDDLTKQHIVNALGYEPLDAANLDELEATVGKHTLQLSELIEIISTKANIEDIPTKLSDLEIDIEIGDGSSEDIEKLMLELKRLNEVKAEIDYVDELINTLDEETNIEIGDLKRSLEDTKSNVAKLESKLDKSIETINNELSNKADIEHIHTNYEDDIIALKSKTDELKDMIENIDVPEGVDLRPVYEKIEQLEANKANKNELPTKLSDLQNDVGYITADEIDLTIVEGAIEELNQLVANKADKEIVNKAISNLQEQIDELDIPEEVDLTEIENSIADLKENKTNKSYVDNMTQHIMNQLTQMIVLKADKSFVDKEIERLENLVTGIDVPEEVDLQPIYDEIEELKLIKSDKTTVQSEISRLEKMIGELAGGGEIDLSDYALKKDVPKSLSQLTNDTEYITIADIPEVDLTDINKQLLDLQNNKANKLDVAEDINKLQQKIDNLDIPEEVDLKPIQNSLELLKENKADISYVQSEVDKLNESIVNVVSNMSEDYALKGELPTKLSDLNNDTNFITIEEVPTVDLSDIEDDIINLENKCETLQLDKADIVYVDDEITKIKIMIEGLDIPEEVDLQPIHDKVTELQAYVDNKLAQKVDNEQYISDIKEIQDTLSSHGLSITELNGEIVIVNSELDKKADVTYVDTRLNGYYKKSETYTRDEINSRIAEIIGNAPENLDTLEKLARALDNDDSFASSVTKELSNKVDKESGKGLSSNDFTNTYKLKLDGIEKGANRVEKLSDLINDKGYITLSEVPKVDLAPYATKSEVENKLSDISIKDDEQDKKIQAIQDLIDGAAEGIFIDDLKTEGSTAGSYNRGITISSVSKADMPSINSDSILITIKTGLSKNAGQICIDENGLLYGRKANFFAVWGEWVSGEEVDLSQIHTQLDKLERDKANQEEMILLQNHIESIAEIIQHKADTDYVEREIIKINNIIKDLNIPNLEPIELDIKDLQNNKADREKLISEVTRLEQMIAEIKGNRKVQPRVTEDYDENEIHVHTIEKPEFTVSVTNTTNDVTQDGNKFTVKHEEGYSEIELLITSGEGDISLDFIEARGYYSYNIYFVDKDRYSSGWIRDIDVFTHSIKEGDRISISTGNDLIFQYVEPKLISEKTIYFEGQPISKKYDDTDIKEDISNIRNNMKSKADKSELPTKLSELENDLDLDGDDGVTSINGLTGDVELDAYNIPVSSSVPSWTINNELARKASSYELSELESSKADKDKVVTSVNGKTGDVTIESGGGSQSSTIVIANYDSHDNSKKAADIIIEKGENAATKINDAIQSLEGIGGEIKLMEGNYNLEYGIAVNVDGVHLTGIPKATILIQNTNWEGNPYANDRKHILDTWRRRNSEGVNVEISNLHVRGAKVSGSRSFHCVGSSKITSCISENSGGDGFYCADSSKITSCINENSGLDGFYCVDSSTVTNCMSENSGRAGFSCWGSSKVTNCISENSNSYGFWCLGTFKGVVGHNILINDELSDSSEPPAVVQYNIIQEGV